MIDVNEIATPAFSGFAMTALRVPDHKDGLLPCRLAKLRSIPYLPLMYDIRAIPDEQLDEFIRVAADAVDTVDRIFATDHKPVCMTDF